MEYKIKIGLEIHAKLNTQSKMFCRCPNTALVDEEPNIRICPICMGMPGVLPKINKKAVEFAIKVGLALNCKISSFTKFDRKNYFYPDLPKGYQISQYDLPIAKDGKLEINSDHPKEIRIRRVHLEEDAGKLIHPEGKNYSLVDLNRAGTPLLEIVTEPDINSPEEAKVFMQELQKILRYLEVSNADMEKGELRCDANISLQSSKESSETNEKVEIKNVNSFRALEKALSYEIRRQSELLKKKKKIIQETRGWDDVNEITYSMRQKEFAEDYRYFPEPDLPPLTFTQEEIEKIKDQIPELPYQKKKRYIKEFNLAEEDARILTDDQALANYFEAAIKLLKNKKEIKRLASLIVTDLLGLLREKNLTISKCRVKPEDLVDLVILIEKGSISISLAKSVLEKMIKEGLSPVEIIEKEGLKQISSEEELEKIAKEVLKENPKPVEDYKKGKKEAIKFLMGKVMQKTKGQANPEKTLKILQNLLE